MSSDFQSDRLCPKNSKSQMNLPKTNDLFQTKPSF